MRTILLSVALLGCTTLQVFAAPFVPVRDPQTVAFSPSGTVVATGCSGMSDGSFPPRPHPDVRKCAVVAIWDVGTGKRLARMEMFGDLTQLAFSPDGTLLAAARLFATPDGVPMHEVRLWDATSGRVVKVLDRCHAFEFSADGEKLAVVSRSKCVIYDRNDWSKEHQIKPLGGCVSVAFPLDGTSLIGVCRETQKEGPDQYLIRKCEIATGKLVQTSQPLTQPFFRVAIAPDTVHLATGHDGGNVLIWDLVNLTPQTRLQTGVKGIAHPFFSPDGKYLAAGCQDNGDVVIWKLPSGEEAGRFTFEKGTFRTYLTRGADDTFRPEKDPARFSFNPDSSAFMVGSYGGIIRQIEGGRELMRFGD
ncbi:WD domain, G-beta repeat [Anatilimnocola aggregata]|uniref:WD domain, G-beta repeat n=1 Tax=Anatilimnocola aggregata TaxID=2528021 RepID=A0A517Y7W2_9BACT|nr:PD40 domain-containing protein [Anatilimnocola aggregata]QDU26320.1 WD domain, G-beta repeat [Anatilimnocola aggregata]